MKDLNKIIFPIVVASILSVASILWSFNTAIASLDSWRESHIILDKERFDVVFGELKELKKGQSKIIAILIDKGSK